MKTRSRTGRFWKFLATTAVGVGTSAALGACDPAVRDAWLVGLQTTTSTLLQTFNDAFYLSLQDENTNTTGLTTT